jgi:hypothetical protein
MVESASVTKGKERWSSCPRAEETWPQNAQWGPGFDPREEEGQEQQHW